MFADFADDMSPTDPGPVPQPSAHAAAGLDLDLTQLGYLMAHELRQPTQAIRSFVSILLHERAGPLNEVQRDFLHTADHAVRRLERLISDVEVTLTQSSALSLVAEPIDLLQHLRACMREVQPLAEANRIELSSTSPPDTSFTCVADPDRIDQVLLNLLENACHYAACGSVVEIRLQRNRWRILCTVTNRVDTVPDDAAYWSDPFRRGTTSEARHPQGKGLGLTVVNQLVAAHGGHTLSRVTTSTVTVGFVLPVAMERGLSA